MKAIGQDNRKLRNAMTVADLRAELEMLPDDAVVLFVCNYGDYHKTQQALPVEQIEMLADEEFLTESAYSQSGIAVEEMRYDDDDEEEGGKVAAEGGRNVVILRS